MIGQDLDVTILDRKSYPQKKEKTRTISFRIPEVLFSEIAKDAKTCMVSPNVLVNQILLDYISWHRYQRRVKMYAVDDQSIIHVLECLNESQRKQIINSVYDSIRDFTLISKKKFDINSCLTVLATYCRIYGISVEENIIQGIRSFTIRHDMGKEFSLSIKEFIEKIFWDLVKIKVDFELTKTCVMATLQSKLV